MPLVKTFILLKRLTGKREDRLLLFQSMHLLTKSISQLKEATLKMLKQDSGRLKDMLRVVLI